MTSTLPQQSTPHPFPPTYIYKILPSSFFPFPLPHSSPSPTQAIPSIPTSTLPPSLSLLPLDIASGYIHLSTSAQILQTLNLFFKNDSSVWILRISYKRVEEYVRWEDGEGRVWDVGEGGEEGGTSEEGGKGMKERNSYFPHLYGNEMEGGGRGEVGCRIGREEVEGVRLFEQGSGGGRGGWKAGEWPWGEEDRPVVVV